MGSRVGGLRGLGFRMSDKFFGAFCRYDCYCCYEEDDMVVKCCSHAPLVHTRRTGQLIESSLQAPKFRGEHAISQTAQNSPSICAALSDGCIPTRPQALDPKEKSRGEVKANLLGGSGDILLMIEILHDLKDPKLWELWHIPDFG